MSEALGVQSASAESQPRTKPACRFQACVGRFDDEQARTTIDELAKWVEDYFFEDLQQRPSKHVYLRTLSDEVNRKIDLLRDSPMIHSAILRQFGASCVIKPMRHTDELYISHYNKDYGGDQGLFSKHYDGNLRSVPLGCVVRSLIYLQSDPTYKVVFGDSQIEKAFTTYEFGLLDFHRELHWVEGEYNPSDQQRILLKCNYLIVPENAGILERLAMGANTAVFYLVRAAMEYSKSPKNPLQFGVGMLCNLFRVLNNVHPLVPFGFVLLVVGMVAWGVGRWVM